VLVAAVDYSAATVTDLAGPIDTYEGIVRGYAEGTLIFTADRFNGSYNNGEFEVAGSYIAPGTPVYPHTDHLGSASLSTDATGGVASEMRYYPYGQTRSGTMDTDRRHVPTTPHVLCGAVVGIHGPAMGGGHRPVRLQRAVLRSRAGAVRAGG
jgi:hypothetical protein